GGVLGLLRAVGAWVLRRGCHAAEVGVLGDGPSAHAGAADMTQLASSDIDNPFFARVWPVVVTHETAAVRALRRENLAGLSGRVLEVGAGLGTNFANYPAAVERVIAVEPEPRLAAQARVAAAAAPVPVVVTGETAEGFSDVEPFDAVVCSLVLCSVRDP